ncbi:MAG: hypothetical protein JWQ72_2715 [Polaromonas sp.]|nr:hypothetical protein [Polaromonas sp.]
MTAVLGHLTGGLVGFKSAWLVAPLGASAVLVFAVPASPMAQPWPVLAGNTLSALVGIAGVHGIGLLGLPEIAAALAVSTAIAAMLMLRCLHPPGGAMALMMVLGGVTDPLYAFFPVLVNSLALVAVGVFYNNLTRHAYPHPQLSPDPATSALDADVDAVLARYNQILDVSRDDLKALITDVRARAYERKLNQVACGDVMSRDVVTAEFGTSLQDAWALMRDKKIKALPVVDRNSRITGIVTLADFMRAGELDIYEGFHEKLRQVIRTTRSVSSSKPEVVGQIMTRSVRVASVGRPLADLIPLFGETGHHHLPVIDDGQRIVGMITQSDVVAALGRLANPST